MTHPLVDRLRRDGEKLHDELTRERYAGRAGIKDKTDTATIFRPYEWIARRDTFLELSEALERLGPGEERARLQRLSLWVADQIEQSASFELEDRKNTLEAQATATLDNERLGYRELPILIKTTADRSRRASLLSALESLWRQVSPLARDILAASREAIESLGQGDYVTVRSALSGFDLRALAASAQAFLTRTDDLYREALAEAARRSLRRAVTSLAEHDVWYLTRSTEHDHLFPRAEMVWRVTEPLGRIGLDPAANGRIRFDLEERPKKSPRAFCAPIRIPDEVVLVIRPSGGMDEYRSFLHELGHALHRARTDATLPFEDRALGDSSVTEGYAMTLDRLVMNRVWLQRVMRIPRALCEMPARACATSNLLVMRRHAAKLCYELELHGGAGEPEGLYRNWLGRANLMPVSGARFAVDVDPAFQSARYVRAWLLEAAMHKTLRERFDEDWFLNPRAGTFLQGLFAHGQRFDASQVADELLGEKLDPEAVALRFEEVLG